MCCVHGEATECVVFIGRQRNAWEPTSCVGTECVVVFIGRASTEQAMETRSGVPQNGGNGPPTIETGVLLIGRGVAYRKAEETDLLRSERGPVDREGSGVPQNGGNGPPTVKTGVLLIGRGVAYRKTEETEIGRAHV